MAAINIQKFTEQAQSQQRQTREMVSALQNTDRGQLRRDPQYATFQREVEGEVKAAVQLAQAADIDLTQVVKEISSSR